MHQREARGILSAYNGMNISRGCVHGCIYCDARSKCYRIEHDFEDVEIKSNAPALLENALKRKRKKCMVGTGAMSDPYIPIQENLANIRACLEIINKYGCGLAIQTKSDMILQDMDMLTGINEKAKCIVETTLTTFDENLCKIIEPNVCGSKRRFEVLRIMRENGIKTIVWLSPFLPFINDTEENLRGLLDYCVQAGVYGIIFFGIGLTLREGNREHFYAKLDQHFPGLKETYQKKYGLDCMRGVHTPPFRALKKGMYPETNTLPKQHTPSLQGGVVDYIISSDNNDALTKLVYDVCGNHGIVCNNESLFEYMRTYEEKKGAQMELF